MTLIVDLELEVLKMYLRIKNEVCRSNIQKLAPEQDTQKLCCSCIALTLIQWSSYTNLT